MTVTGGQVPGSLEDAIARARERLSAGDTRAQFTLDVLQEVKEGKLAPEDAAGEAYVREALSAA
jgi:hypothetical protein